MTLTLRIENHDRLPGGGPIEVSLSDGDLHVGRATSMDWCLPDPDKQISKHHFDVTLREGHYWLTDLSTNGVFVNGRRARLDGSYRLAHGDKLQVGHFIIGVKVVAKPAALPLAIPPVPDPQAVVDLPVPAPALQRPADDIKGNQWALAVPPTALDDPLHRPVVVAPSNPVTPDLASARVSPLRRTDAPPPHASPATANLAPSPATPAQPRPPAQAAHPLPARPVSRPPVPPPVSPDPTPHSDISLLRQPARKPFATIPATIPGIHVRPGGTPQHASTARAASAPAPIPRPAPEPAPVSFVTAFCEGAGLDPRTHADVDPAVFARQLGRTLNAVMAQVIGLLQDRDATKGPAAADTRPDTKSVTARSDLKQALESLFPTPKGSPASDGLAEALADIRLHQMAVRAALEPALTELLADLAPQEIESGTPRGLFGSKKKKAWDTFVARWEDKAARHKNGLPDAFLDQFAKAYAAAIAGAPRRGG